MNFIPFNLANSIEMMANFRLYCEINEESSFTIKSWNIEL